MIQITFRVVACWCALYVASIANAGGLRTVALTGQTAPGTGGATFQTFSFPPVINNSGHVAFPSYEAEASGLRAGLWSEGSGSLTRILKGGDPTPGLAGGSFYDFGPPVLNDAGSMVFSGANFTEQGFWTEKAGLVNSLVVAGQPAPGTSSTFGSDVTQALFGNPGFNNLGKSFFSGRYHGGTVQYPSEEALFTNVRGPLEMIARAPRVPPGGNQLYIQILFDRTLINDSGQIAYGGRLVRGAIDAGTAIYSGMPGAVRTVAQTGSAVPGFPIGVSWRFIYNYFSLNALGDTAFAARLMGTGITTANDYGVWMEQARVPRLIAREGDQAANAPIGTSYGGFFWYPQSNRNGHVAFYGGLAGAGIDSTNAAALWAGPVDDLKIIARSGQRAPGTTGDAKYQIMFDSSSFSLNAAGQVAFLAELTGMGITDDNNTGLWATDRLGNVRLIAREGDALEIATGLTKTVRELDFFAYTNNEDGRLSAFNDLGQVAFHATFTDFTEGLFVSNIVAVPEPGSLSILVVAVLMMVHSRQRQGQSKSFEKGEQARLLTAAGDGGNP